MIKINLHTNNNTTGGVSSYSPMLSRTTIEADSVNSGLAFFVSNNLHFEKGSFNNCLSAYEFTDKIKVDIINPSIYAISCNDLHPSTGDMKMKNSKMFDALTW